MSHFVNLEPPETLCMLLEAGMRAQQGALRNITELHLQPPEHSRCHPPGCTRIAEDCGIESSTACHLVTKYFLAAALAAAARCSGIFSSTASIMARCSRFSCVWNSASPAPTPAQTTSTICPCCAVLRYPAACHSQEGIDFFICQYEGLSILKHAPSVGHPSS